MYIMKITIEKADGEFRVPAKDGYEDGAYYSDDKEDAIAVAVEMYGQDVEIKFRSVPEFVGGKYEKMRPKNESMNEAVYGYIAFYDNKKIEVTSDKGKLDAQNKAQEIFQKMFPKRKVKGYDIALEIAEKDGKQQTIRAESNISKMLKLLKEKLTKDSDGNFRDEYKNTYNQHPGTSDTWKYALVDTGDGVAVKPRQGLKNAGILAVFDDHADAIQAAKHSNKK
jgi:hypothetical protein